ncbi:enoyl-CoA hydratase-related protein, partial [Escherichia coli]
MSESLHLTRNGSILEITLDRPKANAIDAKTSFEMGEVFLNFRDDPQLRVAIITGAGEKFFSAGWDLKAAAEGEALMNPLMILVKIIKLRWIHILSYDQMVSRKINNQTTRCANSI